MFSFNSSPVTKVAFSPVFIKIFTTTNILGCFIFFRIRFKSGLLSRSTGIVTFGLLWFIEWTFATQFFCFCFFCSILYIFSGRFSSSLILKGLEIGISLQSMRRFLITLLLSATPATEDILFSIICDNCIVLDAAGYYFDISVDALANWW